MESTGSYWQNLYVELIKHDLDVTLCNGKFTKNIKDKKTDVKDARWIQKLQSVGLLTGSFLPDHITEILRTYSIVLQKFINKLYLYSVTLDWFMVNIDKALQKNKTLGSLIRTEYHLKLN